MSDNKDYYEILQVHRKAEQEVIDAAYRKLAQKYHPDVSKEPNAAERMKEINVAYEVLGDPNRRIEYDKRLETKRVLRAAAEYKKEQEARIRRNIEALIYAQSLRPQRRWSSLENYFASLNSTAIIRAQDGQFLGLISSDSWEPNSITNRYGSYGSEYSATSIFNAYGSYGGAYSQQSAFNGLASTPPVIVKDGQAVAYLTMNPNLRPSVNPHLLVEYLRS